MKDIHPVVRDVAILPTRPLEELAERLDQWLLSRLPGGPTPPVEGAGRIGSRACRQGSATDNTFPYNNQINVVSLVPLGAADAATALAALAHEGRLALFRLLCAACPGA